MSAELPFLRGLDWPTVRACYKARTAAAKELRALYDGDDHDSFARYALGMVDPAANYSAHDWVLGPKIIGNNLRATARLHDLATELLAARNPRKVTSLIRAAGLAYCKVGVGSELSCLLAPDVYWVCNARSLWTHLLVRHGDLDRANEALELYRDDEEESEMYWRKWAALHREVGPDMRRLVEASRLYTRKIGKVEYFWADAICTMTYEALAV